MSNATRLGQLALADAIQTIDGVAMVNTTPHALSFGVGDEVVSLPTSGMLVNATPVTEAAGTRGGAKLIRTVFKADADTKRLLKAFSVAHPDVVIIGSLIAAQAYPGLVVAMVALPGYERVAPAEKRMDPHTFTTF